MMTTPRIRQHGFSLMEMAIVLTIVGLLLAGMLPTLTSQIEQQRRSETVKQMNDIRDALFGYAIINGHLPCPTTTADPSSANYGMADATCNNPTAEGYLPWKTLGVSETDAWGNKRDSAAANWYGYWRYRADRKFTDGTNKFALDTGFSVDQLSIVNNAGTTITPAVAGCLTSSPTSECPIAIVFSTGPDRIANGENGDTFETSVAVYQSDTPSSTFDDMTIWISRPQLFNRMVSAEKLP